MTTVETYRKNGDRAHPVANVLHLIPAGEISCHTSVGYRDGHVLYLRDCNNQFNRGHNHIFG